MKALILPLAALVLLPACSLFDDTDPREGAELLEECVARVAKGTPINGAQSSVIVTPTYTYDITKASLDDLQDLIVAGSDETAGSRGMASTNETSTAVARFMARSVDEKGAFFMGRDPALYRVRGAATPMGQVAAAGCERQKAGMRLISFTTDNNSPSGKYENNS